MKATITLGGLWYHTLLRNKGLAIFGSGILVAALLPGLQSFDPRALAAFAIYFVWISLAVSWNFAGGIARLLNLGLVAFFGLGAVVGTVGLRAGYPAPLVVLLAGISGVVLAVVLIPTFRLKGLYFAAATFVVPYMIKPLVEVFTGNSTFSMPAGDILSPEGLYYAGIALVMSSVIAVSIVTRSKVGLALRALGNDELASSSLGVDVALYKAIALIMSGLFAAVAGLYYAEVEVTTESTMFLNVGLSLLPVFMVVIGGIGTSTGPIAGALIYSGLNYFVTSQLPGSTFDTFVLSLAIVGIAMFRPRGLVSGRSKP